MTAQRLVRLAVLSVVGILTLPAGAAADSGVARHPGPGAIKPPQGVPSSYVFTHNGWFHPSCVVRIGEDETVGPDLVIRGLHDGAPRFSFSPCAYPRFDNGGHEKPGGAAAPAHVAPQAAGATYDGYIVYYSYDGTMPNAPTLVNDLIVPPAPTNVADQDIAFFNGILTTSTILQPVIDFNGETAKKWSIESEQCCIGGNDVQTTPVVVAVGDTIRGTVTGTGCSSSDVCSNWAITTADITSGKSTTQNSTVVNEAANGLTPASLETYGVTSCDMFPAGGESTFTGTSLTDGQGNVQTVKYQLEVMGPEVDAEVPRTCGQAGKSSGNDYTVIYGTVTGTGGTKGTGGATGTGGTKGTGGATGTGTGGRSGTGGQNGTGGTTGGSGTGSGGTTGNTGGTTGSTGGSPGSTGGVSGGTGGTTVAGTGGSDSTGGVSGGSTGGQTGSTGGTTGAGDTSDGSPGGCSCDTSGNPTPGFSLVFAFVAATIWSRSRRRS